MLTLKIPSKSWLNEATNEFVTSPEAVLQLEHSLISVSRWEAKWKKPFLDEHSKGFTTEEFRDYIRCMTINRNVGQFVYYSIRPDQFEEIRKYISDSHTATTIRDSRKNKQRGKSRVVTSELVYCWMFLNNIPIECEKWHFNRLMMLIQVCSLEGRKGDTMSQREVMQQNRALNSMRKFKHGTKG